MVRSNHQLGRGHLRCLCYVMHRISTLLMFLILVSTVQGQSETQPTSSDETLQNLRMRLERLEHDNRELRSALSKDPADPFVSMLSETTIADLPPSPEDGDAEPNTTAGDEKIESLVEEMTRRMNAQSKAAFDNRNKNIASLESKVDSMLKKPPKGMKAAFGNGGLVFTSNDGNFRTHFGGTVQLDFIAPQSTAANIGGLGPPNMNLTQDSVNFRRIRTRADGTMYESIDWVLETEYTSNDQNTTNSAAAPITGLRNVANNGANFNSSNQQGGNTMNGIQPANCWVTFRDVPALGSIRVGNQLSWFSLDHVMGARVADFMERAPLIDVFSGPNNNGFSPGVSVFQNTPDKMAGLQLGIYKNNVYDSAYPMSVGNAFTYGGRAVWTPYFDEESDGRYLVHTAFGAEYRTFNTNLPSNQDGENVRVRSRGDLRIVSGQLTPNYADTGNFFATDQAVIDPEFAMIWGPWTLQAEYGVGWFYGARTCQQGTPNGNSTSLGNVLMSSGYVECLYFLTGENKNYDQQRRSFGQVIPKNNFNLSAGTYGAWQVGTRYDWTDLNSGLIAGGRNQDVTLGLNWWLNPNVRYQLNLVGTYINNPSTIPAQAGNTIGSLEGSRFTGEGLIMTVGARMDLNY